MTNFWGYVIIHLMNATQNIYGIQTDKYTNHKDCELEVDEGIVYCVPHIVELIGAPEMEEPDFYSLQEENDLL